MEQSFSNQKGFTLVETIIYVALFTVLSLAVVSSLVLTTDAARAARINYSLQNEGYGAMEAVARLVRQASALDQGASVFDSDDGKIIITVPDSVGNTTLYEIAVTDSYYTVNSPNNGVRAVQVRDFSQSLPQAYTSSRIEVEILRFRRVQTGAGIAVSIQLTLRDTRSKTQKSATFYNTVILKNSQ